MLKRWVAMGLLALFLPSLQAGNFWEKKDFQSWSREEAIRILTASPWATVRKIDLKDTLGAGRPLAPGTCTGCEQTSAPEDVFGAGGEIRQGLDRNPRRVVSAEEAIAAAGKTRSYTVRFMTARPVRMAMARYAQLGNRLSPEQAERYVSSSGDSQRAIVAVGCLEGIPEEFNLEAEALRGAAYLQIGKGGRKIDFEHFAAPSHTDQGEALFVFPRFENGIPLITERTKEVRFVLRLNEKVTIEAKFKPKDMQFAGNLEF